MFGLIQSLAPFFFFCSVALTVIGLGAFTHSVMFYYDPQRIVMSVAGVVVGIEVLLYTLPISWFL